MYSNEPIKYRAERRKKPDILCRFLEIAVIIVWFVMLMILLLLHFAQPQRETFFNILFDAEANKAMDFALLDTAFYMLVFLFVFSLISLILNFKRLKRRTDRIRISFIFSLVGSLSGIVIYIIYRSL